MSALHIDLLSSNRFPGTVKLLTLNNSKKPTSDAAQKQQSSIVVKFSNDLINIKCLGKSGDFALGLSPLTRFTPISNEVVTQLLVSGLGLEPVYSVNK